ncbi:unnamed protein product [Cochlearia groenlandica]
MSKDVEDKQSYSNIVAKLMGLETDPPLSRFISSSSPSCSLSYVVDNHEEEEEEAIKLDLVRRKFIDAKSLVTYDDKQQLQGSKEFQEALEVLSSNKDVFVKLLQESNSLFSQPVLPSPPLQEGKRITVLRPSKAVDAQKCMVKKPVSSSQDTGWINAAQPTQIVVLKPSQGKGLDIKAIASLSPPSYFDEAGDAETREMAKDITRQIRETFRNEALSSSSSDLSNGYVGDDASLSRSCNEYLMGNISGSEIMSPSSRHSWDCVDRFESPFSSSSFKRASFSQNSSVYREAKKRLSERWAMMSLNGDTHQQKHFPKASTALRDMLTLSEMKVATRSNEEIIKTKQETRRSVSCIGSGQDQVQSTSDCLNTLEMSKSVPEIRLNGGTSVSGTSNAQAAQELTNSRSLKPSWKVSNLFFFRNKKPNKEKTNVSLNRNMSKLAMPNDAPQQHNISSGELPLICLQDQPSPVSVLKPPFQEECVGNPKCLVSTKPWITQGEEMSLKSNLIDKSPSIGSIARVSSWEYESCIDITKPENRIKEEEEEDWYYYIKTLLTLSGFSSSDPFMTRWHSPDSPIDPSLRDKFANKEFIKRRKQRSSRKLVFDCINTIIKETTSTAEHTDLTSRFDMVEHVWTELKNSNSFTEQSVVRDDVVGKIWSHNLQLEVNNLVTEIEMVLLRELVQEAVF